MENFKLLKIEESLKNSLQKMNFTKLYVFQSKVNKMYEFYSKIQKKQHQKLTKCMNSVQNVKKILKVNKMYEFCFLKCENDKKTYEMMQHLTNIDVLWQDDEKLQTATNMFCSCHIRQNVAKLI